MTEVSVKSVTRFLRIVKETGDTVLERFRLRETSVFF